MERECRGGFAGKQGRQQHRAPIPQRFFSVVRTLSRFQSGNVQSCACEHIKMLTFMGYEVLSIFKTPATSTELSPWWLGQNQLTSFPAHLSPPLCSNPGEATIAVVAGRRSRAQSRKWRHWPHIGDLTMPSSNCREWETKSRWNAPFCVCWTLNCLLEAVSYGLK